MDRLAQFWRSAGDIPKATFRKRGSKWRVQVRRTGHPTMTRSFLHKADAELWARKARHLRESPRLALALDASRPLLGPFTTLYSVHFAGERNHAVANDQVFRLLNLADFRRLYGRVTGQRELMALSLYDPKSERVKV